MSCINFVQFSLLALLTSVALSGNVSTPYMAWMSDMRNHNAIYGGNIYSKTIFDLVWPGSHHAGQYHVSTQRASDSLGQIFVNTTAFPTDVQRAWATRQESDITYQLKAGSRFLDLRFEYLSTPNEYYSHEGLLGADLTTILSQIKKFVSDPSTSEEIIIVSLTNYLMNGGSQVTNTARVAALLNRVVTSLQLFMANKNVFSSLNGITLQNLRDANVNVIFFTDQFGGSASDDYFYDATSYFVNGTEFSFTNFTSTRTHVVGKLRFGWDYKQFNRIFWTTPIGDLYTLRHLYGSYREYNTPALQDIFLALQTYQKLRFTNAFITDYTAGSGIVEQAIVLNYNYLSCQDRDDYWGTNITQCPYITGLERDYRYNNISSSCDSTEETICPRSCGLCTYISGGPGSTCENDGDCTSPYYNAYLGPGENGTCYIPTKKQQYYITEKSFCISATAYKTCDTLKQTECDEFRDYLYGNGSNITCNQCTNNFDCESSYCSSELFVCVIPTEITFRTPAPTTAKDRYSFVESVWAKDFRAAIDWLRPGNPDGEYSVAFGSACNSQASCLELMNKNPYLTSLIGFILIPFTLAIVLFVLYSFCCAPWCVCDRCPKKCCCRPCLGDPNESKYRKHGPLVALAISLCFVIWGCSEGIYGNGRLHKDLFGSGDSFRNVTLDMFDTFIEKFEGIGPVSTYILDNLETVLNTVDRVVKKDDINNASYNVIHTMNNLTNKYGRTIVLTATIEYPFASGHSYQYNITCTYCKDVGDSIRSLNGTLTRQTVNSLNYLKKTLNGTKLLSSARSTIDKQVTSYYKSMSRLINSISNASASTRDILDQVETYDVKRETGGFVFFTIPFSWIVFSVLGAILSSKWFFKINWCLSMYIGAVVMLLFSLFAVTSVGWADFCVRLDDFELNLGSSQLGKLLSGLNHGSNVSLGNNSFTGNSSSFGMFDIINACFTGESLVKTFGLDKNLDWNGLRTNMSSALNFDVKKAFKVQELDKVETEIALLDETEFTSLTDEKIQALNDADCPCIAYPSITVYNRTVLLNNTCVGSYGTCWDYVYSTCSNVNCARTCATPTCSTYYTAAYEAVSAEYQKISEIRAYVDGIHKDNIKLYKAYSEVVNLADRLEVDLHNISCVLGPLFDRFDAILYDFASCGFIGRIYGNYKKVGCVTLFGDMYYISRGMMLIAFLSIAVVICGQCMDYVVDPIDKDDNEDWLEQPRKFYKNASRKLDKLEENDVQMVTQEQEAGEGDAPARVSQVEHNYLASEPKSPLQYIASHEDSGDEASRKTSQPGFVV